MNVGTSQQHHKRPPDGVVTDCSEMLAAEAQERIADLMLELLQHVDDRGRRLLAALARAEENRHARELSLYRARLLDSLPHHEAAIQAALPRPRPALTAVIRARSRDKSGLGARENAHG